MPVFFPSKSTLYNAYKIANSHWFSSAVDVIKLFWRISRNSRFPLRLKQQDLAIFKPINNF